MTIILRKTGFYTKDWDTDLRDYVEEYISSELFYLYWVKPLVIEGEVTLKDFLNIVLELSKTSIEYLSRLVDCNIKEYLEEFNKEPVFDDEDDKITIVEIYKYIELSIDRKIKIPEIQVVSSCHGISEGDKTWAIEMTEVPKLMDARLSLKKDINFYNLDLENNKSFDPIMCEGYIELGEFLYALFTELCFFGSPETRIDFKKELLDRVKEIKEYPERLIPWKDIKDDFDESN